MAKTKKPKKITRETEHGIEYTGWDDDTLEAFPIRESHIGQPIKLAGDPRNKQYDLLEIKEAGEKGFPKGGYLVVDPEYAFPKPLFVDEAISFPPKKKKKGRKRKSKK
jgi:hypothetical protein